MKKIKPIIAITTILIGLEVATTSLSLAWFDNSSFLRIEYFDVSFKAGDELYLSTVRDDPSSYKSALTSSDLKESDLFLPVSTMKSSEWISQQAKNPVFYGDHDRNASEFVTSSESKFVEPKPQIATQGYFSQEIFLKSPRDHWAYLDTENMASYIFADTETNEAKAKQMLSGDPSLGTTKELVERMNYLQKSMRFSVLVDSYELYDYKIFDPFKEEITYFGGTIDSEYKGTFDTKYDVSTGKSYEILYGEVENRDKIVYSLNQNLTKTINPTWFNSGHQANTYVIDKQASVANGVVIASEDSITLSENDEARNRLLNGDTSMADRMLLIPLEADTPTRIVISFYMEGWDKDNVDSAMGGSFIANLQFGLLDRYII